MVKKKEKEKKDTFVFRAFKRDVAIFGNFAAN